MDRLRREISGNNQPRPSGEDDNMNRRSSNLGGHTNNNSSRPSNNNNRTQQSSGMDTLQQQIGRMLGTLSLSNDSFSGSSNLDNSYYDANVSQMGITRQPTNPHNALNRHGVMDYINDDENNINNNSTATPTSNITVGKVPSRPVNFTFDEDDV